MKVKLLLIDDDLVSLSIVAKKLMAEGFQVICLDDATQFESVLQKTKPDLVLLDIIMPQITGLEILKKLRANYNSNELPIIMMTAKGHPEDVVEALELGASDYLTKPINIKIAVSRIKNQLKQISLNKDSILKSELEAINAMIVTYNHEINSPLSAALLSLTKLEQENPDSEAAKRIRSAIERINEILKKIKQVSEKKELQFEDYSKNVKMFKIK